MATLIATADGNLTGSTTFAAAEVGALSLVLNRNNTSSSFAAAGTNTSVTFTVTNAKVIDAVLLWVGAGAGTTGTLKVDLQKGGVSQASVTVNKIDLPVFSAGSIAPVLFKLTTTATGDGGSNWTIVVTTTGTVGVSFAAATASTTNWTRALRTTTTQAPVATDDLYIVGELTGAGTKNTRTVTMDSTAATVYGNGAVNSTSVNGGGIHISNWGTLTYAGAGNTSIATWDSATAALVTLSGGNLAVTSTGGFALEQGARVTDAGGKTTGKYYFEVTVTNGGGGGGNTGLGVGTPSSTYTTMGGNGTTGAQVFLNGNIWASGGAGVSIPSISTNGTVVGVAVDLDNRKIWFRIAPSGQWNGNASYDPATNVGGVTLAAGTMVPFCTFNNSGNVFTANFGATAFSGAVPSGFTSGWSVVSVGGNYLLRVAGDLIVYQYGTFTMGSSAAYSLASYSNVGGTGNRTGIIAVTTNLSIGAGNATMLVNGLFATDFWINSGSTNGIITFDFGTAKTINEFKWYQSGAGAQGTWKFGGSADNISYTEFPELCALGTTILDTFPVTNTTGYRYYRLRQTAGVTYNGPYLTEIEFKIVDLAPASTAILEFQQVSADGDFGLRCLDNSVVNITGVPRTAGKLVTQCKLTANVVGVSGFTGWTVTAGSVSATALEASGNSLLAVGFTDNTASSTHFQSMSGNAVINTTQTVSVWLARGSGLNNRYVRVALFNSTQSTGVYSDIDLQAGTASALTAISIGVATSVSITPEGRGYLVEITGKVSTSGAQTPTLFMYSCSAAGTTTYVGNSTQCFVYHRPVLVTGTSIPDTTFNVDTDTGWLAGDAVCVASTTRTASECEIYPLNANAGASSFTSALPPFSSGSAVPNSATHHGTAPTQAEIGLITRNVKIRSTSPTLMSYVYCTALSTVTASWAEFYYVGASATNKRGIEVDGGSVCNPKSFTYCSVHDLDAGGLWCNTTTVISLNVIFSNNVVWNSLTNNIISITGGTVSSNNWTFDFNLVMRGAAGVAGFYLNDVGGTVTNNTVVGLGASLSRGFLLGEVGGRLGTFSGNTVHACGAGLEYSQGSIFGTVANFSAWRNNSYGVWFDAFYNTDTVFDGLTLFGNTNANIIFDQSGTLTIIGTSNVIAGDASFATTHGIQFNESGAYHIDISNVDMSGSGPGLAPHTNDFHTPIGWNDLRGVANNCKFGAPNLFSSGSRALWSKWASVGFQKYNQTAGDHRTEMTYGQLRTDSVVFHTAAPSMKMTPNNASNRLESASAGRGIQCAVSSGDTVTASVWVRKDGSYLWSQPRLIVRASAAIGISTDTVLATMSDVSSGPLPTFFDASTVEFVSLSSDCLTATHVNSGTNSGARSGTFNTTGKYYFEITFGIAGGATMLGAITTSGTFNGMSLNGGHCCAVAPGSGTIYSSGVTTGKVLGLITTGDVCGVALDLTARKGWLRRNNGLWNNDATHNPVTGAGGVTLYATVGYAPAVSFWTGSAGDNHTLNAGQTAYANAAPSGFGNWTNPAGAVGSATWVQLSGTTTAATDDGVMEFIVDCDGTSGFINVDDWSFTTGGVTTTNDLGNWFNGLPASGTEGGGSAGGGAYFSAGFV